MGNKNEDKFRENIIFVCFFPPGMLYLTQGRMDLANKAFKEGQNQDPAYIQAWIGEKNALKI